MLNLMANRLFRLLLNAECPFRRFDAVSTQISIEKSLQNLSQASSSVICVLYSSAFTWHGKYFDTLFICCCQLESLCDGYEPNLEYGFILPISQMRSIISEFLSPITLTNIYGFQRNLVHGLILTLFWSVSKFVKIDTA